ncbi:hypothetical protein OG357_25680 [Streptomyces sp. NBC_01255]|uniref:hypothetical protein n=1 Tax=Streptomyces sp. NBC_01255 TaxID=2903798 RepID=UPI002E36CADF|nr:hypothetical protein [Streptomyces sp. NBC_01255]
MTQRTDQELAQIAVGAVRLAGGDAKKTKRILLDTGLTDAELTRALLYLESNRPILNR